MGGTVRNRILVVEDLMVARQGLSRLLKKAGYEIFEAATGTEALKLADELKPDLILLDVMLPDIQGTEVCRIIKAQEELKSICIVLASSVRTASDSQAEGLEGGADDYIVRPIPNRQLLARIAALLRLKTMEKRLAEALNFSRMILATAPVGMATFRADGGMMTANEALLTTIGYSAADIPELNLAEITPWKGTGLHEDAQEVIETGNPSRREILLELPHRDPVWLDCRLAGFDFGDHRALLLVADEITARKKAEERFRMAMEASYDGIWDWDMITDHIYRSPGFYSMLGYEEDEFPPGFRGEERLMHPEDLEETSQALDDYLSGKSDAYCVEFRMSHKLGHMVSIQSRGKIAARDNMGNPARMVGTHTDISARKKAEQALKESEARYRQLASVTFEGIVFHDNGVLLSANDQFYAMTGYEPCELVGASLNETTIAAESLETVTAHVASGSTEPFEIVGLKKDGSKFPMEVQIKLQEIGGKDIRAAAFRDISERKEMERYLIEAQKMEAVGTLAGGIAHDFNNLLQIISGHAELLESEFAARGEAYDEMGAIRQAAQRGADLVKQILTYSRGIESDFELIDLNDDVKTAERLLYRTIPKMIEIELQLEKNLKMVRVDSTQVEQLLINLAINAKDAMPDGGKLTITTENLTVKNQHCSGCGDVFSGSYVLLRVADTGHGMDKDVLQHIFEPFFTTKGLADGTGLGLATSFGIIKMHGGHIVCESEVGKGTTFSVYFPAVADSRPNPRAKGEVRVTVGGNETILVADDEPMIANLARKILEKSGYTVLTARSGKEALDTYILHQSRIKLVILDLIMPEMGGDRCLKELLKINPKVKALIASGFSIKGETQAFVDSKAKGRVSKPFNMKELLRSVRNVLDHD